MKKSNILRKLLCLLFFCLGTVACTMNVQAQEETDAKILKGVFIDRVDVSGMTEAQAKEAVDRYFAEVKGYNIQLKVEDSMAVATAGELGLDWGNEEVVDKALGLGQKGNVIKRYKAKKDIEQEPIHLELKYGVNDSKLKNVVEERCVPFDREPVNATMTRDDGEFVIEKEKSGITLKVEESVELIKEYLTSLWRTGTGEITLAAKIEEAKHKSASLKEVQDILGTANTDYSSSSANRAKNIRNGTQKLNGIVLFPGESYSVCDAMVPFSEENGYALGASYANGTVVETFGGGICQVSTTLYLALLRSELEVTERNNHSMIVKYVKPSMDAAISEGSKDLKFVNNLDAPIYISAYTDGGEVGFVIFGKEYRPEDRSVTYESETLETIEPDVKLVGVEKPLGAIKQVESPHTGYVARLWKVVEENGEETRTQVNESTYAMQPTKYEVGTVTDSSEGSQAIQNAINNNDLDAAYEAIHKYG